MKVGAPECVYPALQYSLARIQKDSIGHRGEYGQACPRDYRPGMAKAVTAIIA
jgi:hypothetical protein